jgi:26S proteasome regulatory subunit N1
LKEKLDLLSERIRDPDVAQQKNALKLVKQEISGATATMTSVPKPLKFLIPHYNTLKEFYES